MKPYRAIFILLFTPFLTTFAATFTADNAGGTYDWNDGAAWGSGNSPGVIGVDFPGPGDIVNIPATEIIEIPSGYAASCATLNLNSTEECYASVLTFINSTSSLNVSGNVTMYSWDGVSVCGSTGNVFGAINMNGGTFTVGGNFTAVGYDDGDIFHFQTINTGAGTLTVAGDITFTNNGTGLATINMNTANSVLNVGAGFTLGVLNNGNGTNGKINYTGSAGQTILSAITYYDLETSGGGLKTMNGATLVKGTLTMTSGNIDLATYRLTMKNSSEYSTLVHTSGWAYNGEFERWLEVVAVAIGNVKGLFPVGSSTHYRPLWVSYDNVDLATRAEEGYTDHMGSLIVSHVPTYPATYNVASHSDATWAGGTTLQGVSQSYWSVEVDNDFGIFMDTDMRYGGFGFGTNTLTDLNASLSASVVGTHAAATGSPTEIYVNRADLSDADLDNDHRIGTKNIAQSPLPVELISFTANEAGDKADLQWITATEINNDYFTIQRSVDALTWEDIKQVPGAGNSTTVISYSEIDPAPYLGTSYYRLKQTDFDGKSSYSNTEVVNFNVIEIVNAYPVPAVDNLSFAVYVSHDTEVIVQIYSSLGQIVYSQQYFFTEGMNILNINTEEFARGNYISRVTTSNKEYSDKLLFIVE